MSRTRPHDMSSTFDNHAYDPTHHMKDSEKPIIHRSIGLPGAKNIGRSSQDSFGSHLIHVPKKTVGQSDPEPIVKCPL